MKIRSFLFDLINFPESGGHEYDWRYRILLSIAEALKAQGYKVYCHPMKGVNSRKPPFPRAREAPDVYVARATVPREANFFRDSEETRFLCYDHGWLPKSLVMDRQGLFGSSYYRPRLAEMLADLAFDPDQAEAYRRSLLERQLTKRPQPTDRTAIPEQKYIFIPGQAPRDASILHSSQVGFMEFVRRVTAWAEARGQHVLYKPHPGLLRWFKQHLTKELENDTKELRDSCAFFHIGTGPIYTLMQQAAFTVCINSGSIVDNLVTQTPVYCCGTSFFCESGTVHYDPDIERGLDAMVRATWTPSRQAQQLRLLWWLREHLVQEDLTVGENIRRMMWHLDG